MSLRMVFRTSNGVQGSHIVRTADLVCDGPVSGGRIFHKPIYPGEETLERGKTRGTDLLCGKRGKTRGTDTKEPPPI